MGTPVPAAPADQRAGGPPVMAAPIFVEGAWARAAAAGGTSAIYMVIHNRGAQEDELVAAQSDVANAVELHHTAMDGDVMRMRPIDTVRVPARGQVTLEPGGRHVMLIGLRRQLPEGATVALTLRFARAGEMTLQVPVRAAGGVAPGTPVAPAMPGGHDG
jgi:copper(I)-binding protein